MSRSKPKKNNNVFEQLLKHLMVRFNPNERTLTLKLPNVNIEQVNDQSDNYSESEASESEMSEPHVNPEEIEILEDNISLESLVPDKKITRVKISTKAYIKLALHALKYANDNIPQTKWVEVIGLLTGKIEHRDTPLACLNIYDAFPIGHGTDVTVHIKDPQSTVRVYKELKKGESILGWYHSHPSYSPFMSDTDFRTQVRYQRLSKAPQLIAPIALVIDPTMITTSSYGFKIFRLKENYKKWEEPAFEVKNLPLESLPGILETLMPLTKNKKIVEYDFE
ncbi:MAG: Mov34/MPN/PAD-1 family protein [Candidatus Hodarchaeales archaeon]